MYFLESRNLGLRPLVKADINSNYIRWMNDREVNRYSRRIFAPTSEMDIIKYLEALSRDEFILAICIKDSNQHIGNIKYGPIDYQNKICEIRIVIGEKDEWGKGYGSETIYAVCKHLFNLHHMNRVEANSANPAFINAVKKLGWSVEGELRERFYMDGSFVSYLWMSILRKEFEEIPNYEPI